MSDNKTIWKFTIPVTDVVEVEMPRNARVLPFVQTAKSGELGPRAALNLWAEVHPNLEKVMRRFHIVGTGNPFPNVQHSAYVGSVVDGPFVWHVYEGMHHE